MAELLSPLSLPILRACAQPAAAAQSTVATVGVLLSPDELLLLGPDGAPSTDQSLLAQLGLQSWRESGLPSTAAAVAEKNVGGLGGGFKRFRWEPHSAVAGNAPAAAR